MEQDSTPLYRAGDDYDDPILPVPLLLLPHARNVIIPAPRMFLAALACLQNALIGGVVLGWASIDRGLLAAPLEQGGANLSFPAETTQIFAWASSTAMLSTLVLGAVLDRYGPRTCSVVSHVAIALGFYLFSTTASGGTHQQLDQQQRFAQFSFATCLIAFGGPGIQVSVVHVSNLFASHGNQFLVLSGMTGCICLSCSVFTVFDWIWETYQGTVDLHFLFGVYALVVLASLVGSILFWPSESFPAPKETSERGDNNDDDDALLLGVVQQGDDDDQKIKELYWEDPTPEKEYVEATTAHQHLLAEQPLGSYLRADNDNNKNNRHRLLHSISFHMSRKALKRGDHGALLSIKDQPFWRQLQSSTYIRSLIFLLVTCFLANFYVASFSTELADLQYYSLEDQRLLARVFTLIMSSGFLASILVGWLMDRCGQEVCTVITLLLGQTQLLVLLFLGLGSGGGGSGGDDRRKTTTTNTTWMVVSFVLYSLFRQFLFPVFIANLTDRLGFKYFGLLNGITFAVSGLSQLYMASLVTLVQGDCHLLAGHTTTTGSSSSSSCFRGHWMQLHWMEVALICLLFVCPFMEYKERRQRESQRKSFLRHIHSPSASFNYGSMSTVQEEEEILDR